MVIEQQFEKIISEHNHKFKVIPLMDLSGNQSVQLLLSCGCFQVLHVLDQKEKTIASAFPDDNGLTYYEFCAQHLLTIQKN